MDQRKLSIIYLSTLIFLITSYSFVLNWYGTVENVTIFLHPLKFKEQTKQGSTIPIGWSQKNLTMRKDLVYYNRVPKCGSSTFLVLISLLSQVRKNSFCLRLVVVMVTNKEPKNLPQGKTGHPSCFWQVFVSFCEFSLDMQMLANSSLHFLFLNI